MECGLWLKDARGKTTSWCVSANGRPRVNTPKQMLQNLWPTGGKFSLALRSQQL